MLREERREKREEGRKYEPAMKAVAWIPRSSSGMTTGAG